MRRNRQITPSWLWDPSAKNYTWPNVHSYCIPCKKQNVGTCFLSGCYGWRGPTDCLLTRCVCKKGYCAKEDALPGQEVCEPQICVGGPRPFPARRGFSVNLFYWMLGSRHFPSTSDTSSSEVKFFGLMVALHALWVPLLGVLSIFATMFGFHYYRAPKAKRVLDAASDSPTSLAERILHWQYARSEDGSASPGSQLAGLQHCREPRRAFAKKPPLKKLIFVCAASVAICYLGVYIREGNWNATVQNTERAIARFKQNAITLRRQGSKVARTCDDLNVTLQAMNTSCAHDPLMITLSNAATDAFRQYINYVTELNGFLHKLPGVADHVKALLDEREESLMFIPLIPVMTVAVLIVILVSEVLIITTYGKLKWALRLGKMFEYSTCLLASLITFLTVFVYIGFCFAMALGSFCYDVDENVMNLVNDYVVRGNHSDEILRFTEYYITGAGVMNPVMTYTKKARLYIDEILDVYLQFEGVVRSFYPTCQPLEDLNLRRIAKEARSILHECVNLLEPANVYPYYEDVMRLGVCQEVMHSLANFPVFTLVLGLVIFPTCAVYAHRYLVHWSYWKHQEHGLINDFEESEEEVDWSGTSQDDDDTSKSEEERQLELELERRRRARRQQKKAEKAAAGSPGGGAAAVAAKLLKR